MQHITILGLNISSGTMITGPLDLFHLAGRLWNGIFGLDPAPCFEVEIANSDLSPVQCTGRLAILPHKRLDEIESTDLILIPSIVDIDQTLADHPDALPWLKEQHGRGVRIAAMCTGTFVLAETGLLDHKTATTHWGFVEAFRQRYPQVNLIPERLITDETDLFCCGASNACFDLSLYLIEKLAGRETALQTAKVFVCDMDRTLQSEWAVFRFQKSHKDAQILRVQQEMESSYAKHVTIAELARMAGMGKRTLERRFRAATGDSPLQYRHRLRVEAAKRMMETGGSSFEEIAFKVGYDSPGYFRKIFTRICRVSPGAYRKKWAPPSIQGLQGPG